jgi:hypothetical protein
VAGICFLLTYVFLAQGSHMPNSPPQQVERESYIVTATLADLAHGYNKWQAGRSNGTEGAKSFRLGMPILDLYSPSGTSLYHGEDSTANATFLRSLPKAMGRTTATAPRPSLKEAIEMFPELKLQEDTLLADKRYTVFAITDPTWDHCKDQNDAVAKLRESKDHANIRVIEVRLHK